MSPKIAIIGAGPAGLTLARLLHLSPNPVSLTVYERDVSPTSRPDQGGSLDLHADTGLAAIRKCNLWSEFQEHARYDGQELIIADKNATQYVHLKGGKKEEGKSDRPEIDREELRKLLLESVPAQNIQWARTLAEVTEEGRLRFDGREELAGPFDLIVGADGGWSRVRAKLTDVRPAYAGLSGYEMEIRDPAKTCPHVDKMVGRGSFFGTSSGKWLNAQRMGNDGLKVRSWQICPEGEAEKTLAKHGNSGTRDLLLDKYADFAPEIRELLVHAVPDTMRLWPLYELPVGTKWEHKVGFTLLGDAASLAAPFSGEGVNKAMKDALELAELIEKSQDMAEKLTLDGAVSIYEQRMFPRAEKLQAITMENKQNMFGPDAPVGFMALQLRRMTSESPSVWVRMLGSSPFVRLLYSLLWVRKQIGWAVRRFWRRT